MAQPTNTPTTTTRYGKGRSVALLVALLAVVVGVIGTYKPSHFLALPFPLGILLWVSFGGDLPPYMFVDPWEEEEIRTWTKPGDLVVSVGIKSGTTWMLYCTHQIRVKAADDADELFQEVSVGTPWPDLRQSRHDSWKAQKERFNTTILPDGSKLKDHWDNPRYPFRIFKSHYSPKLPGNEGEKGAILPVKQNPQLKFLAMSRNGLDVVQSMVPFLNSHTDEWRNLFGGIPPKSSGDIVKDTAQRFQEMLPGGNFEGAYFPYVKNWWRVKDEPNVLLLHYADAKKDLKGTVQQLAKFLDVNLTEDQVKTVTERCGIDYMRRRDHLFLYSLPLNQDSFWNITTGRAVKPGSMVRTVNDEKSDAFTQEQRETWAKAEEEQFGSIDANMLRWARDGGPFSSTTLAK